MTFTFTRTDSASQPQLTLVADRFVELKSVECIRLAVYDNHLRGDDVNETQRWAIELDYHFDQPQPQWTGAESIKLRNWGSKLSNIRYKLPKSLDFANDWYARAFELAQTFEHQSGWAVHAKMGARLICAADGNEKYQTVPFQVASFSIINEVPTVLLQSCRPSTGPDGVLDYSEGFAERFELSKTSDFRRRENRRLFHSSFKVK